MKVAVKKTTALFFTAVCLAGINLTGCTTTSPPKPEESETKDYTTDYEHAEKLLNIRQPENRTEKKPLVLVHYMPWFQAPPVSDGYGFHWHQGGAKFDPYQILSDGCANIASHQYPLTGPYDSRDRNILEYQAALMKISGIDGVIFDWYGIDNALDYKEIQESTLAMIGVLKSAGLRYCICYEDQSVGKMVEAGSITKADAVETGKKTFKYMNDNWFSDASYVKYENRPVVMTFGPQYFFDRNQWDEFFSVCSERPYFITLEGHSESFADGSYNWFNMNGKKTAVQSASQLNNFYAVQYAKPFLVATAYAEFYDIYGQAGGKSYGYLDYAAGKTFNLTLKASLMAYPDIIQIATWNDYGEGTCIEPTIQRGYEELEVLRNLQKKYAGDFPYTMLDLRAPLELYKIIVSVSQSAAKKNSAERALKAVLSGDVSGYRTALADGKIIIDYAVKPVLQEPSSSAVKSAVVYDAGGRKNAALGVPAVVNNKIYDFAAGKAVDGDVNTYWEGAANKYPNTFQVDLGSPLNLDFAVLKLNPQRIWGKRSQTIGVQTSGTGIDFTTLVPPQDYAFDPAENSNTVLIQLNATARYVRFVFTKNTGGTAGQIAELEVYVKK
ncbi:MAG TPA: hypothetical protein DCL73_15440 [Treponema sp.]|nr:hypothetical protein [Treponema sp.]